MEGAAHDPAFARRMGIPQSVAAEFVAADKASGKYRGQAVAPEHHFAFGRPRT